MVFEDSPTSLTLADRREIDDLYIRYCWALNERDALAWADCFTPDGLFVPSYGKVRGEYQGRAALIAFASDQRRNQATRHWNANVCLMLDGKVVRSACYCLLVDYSNEAPQLLTHVVYHDVLTCEWGRWLFVERRPQMDRAG
jgi:hypothetical protein